MYENEIWQQNIAKQVLEMHANQTTLLTLLTKHGTVSVDEFKALKTEMLKEEPYQSALKTIDENIAQYEKWAADPHSAIDDWMADLFHRKQETSE